MANKLNSNEKLIFDSKRNFSVCIVSYTEVLLNTLSTSSDTSNPLGGLFRRMFNNSSVELMESFFPFFRYLYVYVCICKCGRKLRSTTYFLIETELIQYHGVG